MVKRLWESVKTALMVGYLCFLCVNLTVFVARKRLKEQARENDIKIAKKARKLAEASAGDRGSILKHLQTGISAAPKPKATDVARKSSKYWLNHL